MTFFAVVGVVVVAIFAIRVARLVWYRAKALAVINNYFGYRAAVPGSQSEIFFSITRAGVSAGWNEFDVAIAFMLSVLGALTRPFKPDAHMFYYEKLDLVMAILPRSTAGNDLLREFRANQEALMAGDERVGVAAN